MNPKRTMRRIWLGVFLLATAIAVLAKTTPARQEGSAAKPQAAATNGASKSGSLDQVLHSMDENAAKFRAAQADFTWTPYNAVINDTEAPDKGRIYFRRTGNEIQMAAVIQPPDNRQILLSGGKIQVYQPKTKVLDVYDVSAHKDEVESFLVLGFGSSGQDLRKSFEVKYLGEEKIDNVQTAKLELIPLSDKIKKTFPKIDLWIDPQRGVSLRQQLFQTGGDYRMADYSNIQLRGKLPDNLFKLKTSGVEKTVNH